MGIIIRSEGWNGHSAEAIVRFRELLLAAAIRDETAFAASTRSFWRAVSMAPIFDAESGASTKFTSIGHCLFVWDVHPRGGGKGSQSIEKNSGRQLIAPRTNRIGLSSGQSEAWRLILACPSVCRRNTSSEGLRAFHTGLHAR